jgi:hypothetical protein
MEAIHTVATWLAVWVGSSVVLSPLLGRWIRNRTKHSLEGSLVHVEQTNDFDERKMSK